MAIWAYWETAWVPLCKHWHTPKCAHSTIPKCAHSTIPTIPRVPAVARVSCITSKIWQKCPVQQMNGGKELYPQWLIQTSFHIYVWVLNPLHVLVSFLIYPLAPRRNLNVISRIKNVYIKNFCLIPPWPSIESCQILKSALILCLSRSCYLQQWLLIPPVFVLTGQVT